jgi:hypothetical protein
VLARFGMETCNAARTPAEAAQGRPSDSAADDAFPYREAVGCLMYLATCTRPDIAYAVSYLARSTCSPSAHDVAGVKRVLRYLRGTIDCGVRLGGGDLKLTAYADADYASEAASRRSVSGNLAIFGGGPVLWSSRLQACVTLSTVEAEYVSLCGVAQSVIWLRGLLQDLGAPQRQPTVIYEDNLGAISLAKGQQVGRRSKHIDVRYHYVREQHEGGVIEVTHCASADMLADILTKPLGATVFDRLKNQICHTPVRVREGVMALGERDRAEQPA